MKRLLAIGLLALALAGCASTYSAPSVTPQTVNNHETGGGPTGETGGGPTG